MLGIVVVIKENLTLPWWGFIVALALGTFVAPFSTILYSRFGNGIATNSLMKMVADAVLPGRPAANLYFTAWSHSVISQSLNLASDLKMGEYLKIPPRVMFLTQIWGTIFGAFINYAVMISIVNSHRDILTNSNGSQTWSGASFQSLNTQATTWALPEYLYSLGQPYVLVPLGLAIGFGLVLIHRAVYIWVKRVGRFDLADLNLPTLCMYSGWLGYNQTQSCTVLARLLAGFYVQYYLRNYKPNIFKKYQYLVTAAVGRCVPPRPLRALVRCLWRRWPTGPVPNLVAQPQSRYNVPGPLPSNVLMSTKQSYVIECFSPGVLGDLELLCHRPLD